MNSQYLNPFYWVVRAWRWGIERPIRQTSGQPPTLLEAIHLAIDQVRYERQEARARIEIIDLNLSYERAYEAYLAAKEQRLQDDSREEAINMKQRKNFVEGIINQDDEAPK
jgi:hypothetical protein